MTEADDSRLPAPGSLTPARRWVVAVALAGYLALLLYVMLAPTSDRPSAVVTWMVSFAVGHGAGASTVTFARVELLMNVAMMMPVSMLGSLLWPRWTWRDWTAYGLLGAGTVELAQVLMPGRDASYHDVVANAAGILLGALAIRAIRPIIT